MKKYLVILTTALLLGISIFIAVKLQLFSQGHHVVTISQMGFTPQFITIPLGTEVTWKNKSGGPATVDSDPHPIHSSFPPLNLGSFDDESNETFMFEEAGTYNYHDHYHPERKGTIVVK